MREERQQWKSRKGNHSHLNVDDEKNRLKQQMRACFFLFVTLVHIFLRGCKIKGSGLIRNRGEAGGEDGAVRNTNQTLFPLYRCWLDASPNTDHPLNKHSAKYYLFSSFTEAASS